MYKKMNALLNSFTPAKSNGLAAFDLFANSKNICVNV